MIALISNILLFLFFFIFPFGEIARLQFNNGINITAIDIIGGCIFIFTFFQYLKNRNYYSSLLSKPLLVFIVAACISLLFNIVTLTPFQLLVASFYLLRWVSFVSIFFFVRNLPKSQKQQIPMFITVSGFFIVLFGYLQYFLYPNLRNLIYLGWDEHYLRLFSTFFDPNYAGIFLVLYFLFILHIWIKYTERRKIVPIMVFGILNIITCIAIFFTLSRDSFIVLTIGLVAYLIFQGNKKYFSIFGIVVSLFILCIFFLARLPTEGAHMLRIASSVARITEAKHALTIISEHPIFGVGFNAYRYAQLKHGFLAQNSWESSHAAAGTDNSFLFVFATTGIIGVLAFCFLLFRIMKNILMSRSTFSPVIFSCLISLIISSLFINSLFYAPLMACMWILLGLIENT